MSDAVHVDVEGLEAAIASWRADVPKAVPYELPTGADDVATTAVLAAMAHWPVEHAMMAAHRETSASRLHTATNATTGILTTTDDEGAAQITASKET